MQGKMAVLGRDNDALRAERAAITAANRALLDERAAFEAVEHAMTEFAEKRRATRTVLAAMPATPETGQEASIEEESARDAVAIAAASLSDARGPVDAGDDGKVARVRKLHAKIRATVAQEDETQPEQVLPVPTTEVEPEIATSATPAPTPAETIGLSPREIEVVDGLVARDEAPDRTAMLRVLVLRALNAEGAAALSAVAGARREEQAIPG